MFLIHITITYNSGSYFLNFHCALSHLVDFIVVCPAIVINHSGGLPPTHVVK